MKYKQKKMITLKKKQKVESLKIKKEIHDFKKQHNDTQSNKCKNVWKFINNTFWTINKNSRYCNFKLFDRFVRLGIVIGGFAINPILGVITLVTGFFLKMKVSRDRMEEVCARYEKERDHYKKKMNEATDEKKKKKYEELYKQYKSDLNKLEMYRDELYTEKENDKRMEEKYAKEAENNSDDFDFDFDTAFIRFPLA